MDYGSASRKHLESNTNASNNKRVPLKSSLIFPGHGSGSRPAKNSDTYDTIYSSSSDSSSDDFIQVNTKTLPKFKAPNNIPKPNGGPKSLYKNEKFDVSSETFYRLEESINESPQSTSQFSDISYDSLAIHPSTILSPPVQVMERAEPTVFDPNRIPTSIFSRPSTPTDWSVASNESLFSIHIGNNSFSRDHIARINYKSGELLKSGELCRSPEIYQSEELCMADDVATPCETMGIRQTSPIAKGVESNKDLDMERNLCEDLNPRETGIVVRVDDVAKVPMNNRVDANLGEFRDLPSANRHSDKSETYIQSVAVPRKKKKSSRRCCKALFCCNWSCFSCKWISCCFKWSSCSCKWLRWPSCSTNCCKWPSCPSCKWPSCPSCKWPSCPSCKWPSCPSCKWPSCLSCKCHCLSCSSACCSCWKHKPQRSVYDSSYILKDRGITGSEKVYPEPQHITRPSSLKASPRKRCSCFTCTSSCSCCSC